MRTSLSKLCVLLTLTLFSSQALAEYYVVQSAPPRTVIVCNTCKAPQKVIHKTVHHPKKCYTKHKRHKYIAPKKRSHYSVSVYYPVVSSCGYYSPCQTCNACVPRTRVYEEEYVIERREVFRAYYPEVYYYDDWDFDFDRRTADDVGAEMNIDY